METPFELPVRVITSEENFEDIFNGPPKTITYDDVPIREYFGCSYPATSMMEFNKIVRFFLEYHPTIPCEKCNGSKTYYFNPDTKMITYIGEGKHLIKCPAGSVTACIDCIRKAIK